MNKFNYYTDAFKKYATFKGRANLPEFWYFVLFNFIISLVLGLIHQNLGNLYGLLVLIPSLALGARRLHDIGKSGWLQLVGLIPIIGWIWLIILFVKKGDEGDNEYGAPVSVAALKVEGEMEGEETKSFGEKIDSFTDKVEDLGEKMGDKVEGLSEKIGDKVEDLSEKVEDGAKDLFGNDKQ